MFLIQKGRTIDPDGLNIRKETLIISCFYVFQGFLARMNVFFFKKKKQPRGRGGFLTRTNLTRVCSGPLCGYPPSLGGTIQRRQLHAPRFLGDPLQVRGCSDTVLLTAVFF